MKQAEALLSAFSKYISLFNGFALKMALFLEATAAEKTASYPKSKRTVQTKFIVRVTNFVILICYAGGITSERKFCMT